MTLISAALFALTSVLLRKMAPSDLDVSAWIGMNGFLALAIAPGLLVAAHRFGLESFRLPSSRTLACLLLNAFMGSTISSYLYSCSLLMLSPLVATVCLSASIPVSAIAD